MRGVAFAIMLMAFAAPTSDQTAGQMAGQTAGQPSGPETVEIADGAVVLRARFAQPPGVPRAPAVIALHGCGGPWAQRDRQWERILTQDGHPALFPDSFGSRGLGSQCKVSHRTVSPGRERRADTVAAIDWMMGRPAMPAGGVVVMGWSNGGSTVLATAAEGVTPPGSVRGFVALYPGCGAFERRAAWRPSAPVLILMGETDDWTPAAPCHALAARFPDRITLVTYPDTFHDFDVPGRPVRTRDGLAYTAGGTSLAHTGTNEASRADAIRRVLAFLDR